MQSKPDFGEGSQYRPKILILEDDCALGLLLEEQLTSFGNEVVFLERSDNNMERALAMKPDLIISSAWRGCQLAQAIQKQLPNTLLLVLTGSTLEYRAAAAYSHAQLMKPAELDVIIEKVRSMLHATVAC